MKRFSLLLISLLICSGVSFAATAPGSLGTASTPVPGMFLFSIPPVIYCTGSEGVCYTEHNTAQLSDILSPYNTPVPPALSMIVINDEDNTDGLTAIIDVEKVEKIGLDENISKYVIKTKPTTRNVSEREAFKWLYEAVQAKEAARNDQAQQATRP